MAKFDDLMAANRDYAAHFMLGGFDGLARSGVLMVTCMDSRMEPLEMIGLRVGQAKILRTPGGHVTPDAAIGCAVGAQLLGVNRILVVEHTRCAMGAGDDESVRAAIKAKTGCDASGRVFGADPNQQARLNADVEMLRADPLIHGFAEVGGFMYDVDTGLLSRVC